MQMGAPGHQNPFFFTDGSSESNEKRLASNKKHYIRPGSSLSCTRDCKVVVFFIVIFIAIDS